MKKDHFKKQKSHCICLKEVTGLQTLVFVPQIALAFSMLFCYRGSRSSNLGGYRASQEILVDSTWTHQGTTLPETNIAPENPWLEDEISFWGWPISRCYVSFREGIHFIRSAVDHMPTRPRGQIVVLCPRTVSLASIRPLRKAWRSAGGVFFGPGGFGGSYLLSLPGNQPEKWEPTLKP